MKTAEQEVSDFNRRFRVGSDVDVLWDNDTGRWSRHTLVTPAAIWQSGESVAEVSDVGFVLTDAIHMPPGVGG